MTKEDALVKMAGLCARSEQCEVDIVRKLRTKMLSMPDTAWVIDELKRRRFLDNGRFAAAYARDKVRFSSWGRMKIRAGLAAKCITGTMAAEAMESIDPGDYAEAISKAAKTQAGSVDLSEKEGRVKLYRHLLSRGFESDLALAEVRKLLERQ